MDKKQDIIDALDKTLEALDRLNEQVEAGLATCPICGSHDTAVLGVLGRQLWLRCRDCGMDYRAGL